MTVQSDPLPTPQLSTTPPAPRPRTGPVLRLLAATAAILAVVGGLAGAGLNLFEKTVEPRSVQREIARATYSSVRVAATDIRCPGDVPARTGAAFTCTGTVDTQPVTFSVYQDDDQGHLTITSDRLLRLDAVEKAVAEKLAADLHVVRTVGCGPAARAVVPNTPGEEIDCTATNPADPSAHAVRLTATVDDDGATSYRIT